MSISRATHTLQLRHLRKRCVQCGLGMESQSRVDADLCPRCGCDLATRPPKSYAEMEGLFDLPPEAASVDAVQGARADAAAARWLLVVAGVAISALATLTVTMLLVGR